MNARRIEITLSQERWEQLEAALSVVGPACKSSVQGGSVDSSARGQTARELAMERQRKLNEAESVRQPQFVRR
jgi:hypothetical protein